MRAGTGRAEAQSVPAKHAACGKGGREREREGSRCQHAKVSTPHVGSWATGPGLPQCFLHCSGVSCTFPVVRMCFFCLGGGGARGGSYSYCVHAKNTGICSVFAFLYNALHKDRCGTRHVVTSVPAFRDDDKNTGIYRDVPSLYNILHKDVKQAKLSQASMPLASMDKTLVFPAFSAHCTTYGARMQGRTRSHKHPCQLRRCPKHWYLPRLYNTQAQGPGTRKAVTKHPCLWRPG